MRSSLVGRSVLLAVVVAVIATVVAGLLAFPLIRAAAETQASARLSALADVTASSIDRRIGSGRRPLPPRLAQTLLDADVSGYLVFDTQGLPPELPAPLIATVLGGAPLSNQIEVEGVPYLIEGRPLSDGSAVLLVQPQSVAGDAAAALLTRLAIALGIGLLVAVTVGVVAARRLTRPLREARAAAARIASGDRDVAITPAGPSEVADIAVALNQLSSALGMSEQRQREFLLSVSHELRTPLTAIRGYGEALREGIVDAGDAERAGAIITDEANRLERLVSDLLDLARLGAVDFTFTPIEVDLDALLSEAAEVWMDRCARVGVTLQVHRPHPAIDVTTDPIRVRQIIDNLMENALRVSPRDSTMQLAISVGDVSFVITVRDCGPGLSPDDLAIAFEPGALYERYRGVRPVGTGLGLALVDRLARGLGGSATVQSVVGGGATFTVTLPR